MLRPLHDRLIVRPIKTAEETRPSGIVVVQENEREDRGVVVAVSSGYWDGSGYRDLSVQVGETVLYNSYGGQKVKVEGEELLLLRDADILAVEA